MAGYGTDDGLGEWLLARGLGTDGTTLPAEALRIRASDYLDAVYGADFLGEPTGGYDQERSWPRTGVVVRGQTVPSDSIPLAIERATYAAAWYEDNNPGSLAVAASSSGIVKRKKVDVLEVEYFAGQGSAIDNATIRLTEVEGLLAPFLKTEPTSGMLLRAVG